MKNSLILAALAATFVGSVFAQTAAPSAPSASASAPLAKAAAATPPPPAAAVVSGVCKDGSPFSADKLSGACRGHGGVDKKASAGAKGAATPAAASTAPAKAKADVASTTAAPGGGPDKVWANDSTKAYHCAGDKFYGKTKHGEYLTEADAKAKGFHGSHGKSCATK